MRIRKRKCARRVGVRRDETLSMRAAYETAVQTRVMRERAQRRKRHAVPRQARPALTARRVRGRPGKGMNPAG